VIAEYPQGPMAADDSAAMQGSFTEDQDHQDQRNVHANVRAIDISTILGARDAEKFLCFLFRRAPVRATWCTSRSTQHGPSEINQSK
jgi:hypothetical protein